MHLLHIQHELIYDRENEEKEMVQLVTREEERKKKEESVIIPLFILGTSVFLHEMISRFYHSKLQSSF